MVHQVFLDVLTHAYFSLDNAALMILDECHHAQLKKNHPYSSIMRDYYQRLKESGCHLPKILGLSACLVVKTITPEKFHEEKNNLESIMDARVETTEDLYEILKYVTNPTEEIVVFDTSMEDHKSSRINDIIDNSLHLLSNIFELEQERLQKTLGNINIRETANKDLKKDYKLFKNDLLRNISDAPLTLSCRDASYKYP